MASVDVTKPRPPIRVLITGAAGQIGYILASKIAVGMMFGPNQSVILHLLEIPQMLDAVIGTKMELEDCASPLLCGVVATTDICEAFSGVDVACLVGARPRGPGMERADLLKANAAIFKVQGRALNDYSSKNVKIVVVGNPANTNAWILSLNAPNIPRENISALTRLDHNRAISKIANALKLPSSNISNVIIWGNHSSTQYPDVNHAIVKDLPSAGHTSSVLCADMTNRSWLQWLQSDFISEVQTRGAAVIKARKLSSAMSAANAIVEHIRDWCIGTRPGEFVSMAVVSDGSYGVPRGLIYSFPVICREGKYTIVQGLEISSFSRRLMDVTAKELIEESEAAREFA